MIEQDIAFAPRNAPGDRSVVAHDAKLAGAGALAPAATSSIASGRVLERALAAGQKQQWPVVVLHLDFKSNEREHHRAVWDLLKQHQAWLTTAAAESRIRRGSMR